VAGQPDLTVEEVAAHMRAHPETIRNWIRAGEFPNAYRHSRRSGWRIPLGDVQAFKEKYRREN